MERGRAEGRKKSTLVRDLRFVKFLLKWHFKRFIDDVRTLIKYFLVQVAFLLAFFEMYF